jgi:hypothetical protein
MFPGYCTPPLPQRSPGWETRRDGRALRKLVKRRALELDWELAGGAAVGHSDELRLRAEQLLLPQGREELARSIDRLVSWTDQESDSKFRVRDGERPRRMPIRREKVWACRPLLVELAERLRGGRRVSVRAVAMASVLIRDRSGPLYDRDQDRRLQRAIQTTLSLFEGERAFVRR